MTNHSPAHGSGDEPPRDEPSEPSVDALFRHEDSFDDTLRIPKGRRAATDAPNDIWAERRPVGIDVATGEIGTPPAPARPVTGAVGVFSRPVATVPGSEAPTPADASTGSTPSTGSIPSTPSTGSIPSPASPASEAEDSDDSFDEVTGRVEPLAALAVDRRPRQNALSLLPNELAHAGRADKPRKAKRGFAGFLNRMSGGLLSLRPGGAEARELTDADRRHTEEAAIRQATWSRAVSVLVANRKGGVGKTPTALILGGVLASIRGGSVAVLEVTDDPGALGYRAEGSPTRGLGDLVRDVDAITSAGQLAGYTAPQTSFASVIASTGHRQHLMAADVVAVSGLIDEFYAIRVMDSGNQPSSSAFLGAVEVADVLVVPVLNAGDAVLEAVALLEHLRSMGPKGEALADGAIIVRLTDGRPENAKVLTRIDRILTDARPAHVLHVPYDAHIAERGQISLASLQEPTLRAFIGIAERVVERLVAIVR